MIKINKIFFTTILLTLIANIAVSQTGSDCNDPHIVTSLPFEQTGMTTQGYGNNYDNTACCNSVYMTGMDYVFSYTPAVDESIRIQTNNTNAGTGLFIIKGCPDDPSAVCVDMTEGQNGDPLIFSVDLMKDSTYYIVVSTYTLFGYNQFTPFDISIQYAFPLDAKISNVYRPRTSCNIVDDVALFIKNIGVDTITSIDVGYNINNGTPVVENLVTTIPPNQEVFYVFTNSPDLSSIGQPYYMKFFTMLSGDGNVNNDTVTKNITHSASISTFPYLEDFEGGTGYWTTDWAIKYGTESSWEHGQPNASIIDTAHSGTNAWVTGLSGNTNQNEISFLMSPCFDFTGITLPILDLWIWYETQDWDYIRIDYSIDTAMSWQLLGHVGTGNNWYNTPSGNNEGWYDSSGGWINAIHPLSGLGGETQVQFRIRFEGGVNGTAEGFAVDDIQIYESPLNDLGIINVSHPYHDCGYTANENISIDIYNYGLYLQDTFNVFYSLDGGNNYITETITDTILSLDTMSYTFISQANLTNLGEYELIVGTFLSGDGNLNNDTMFFTFNHFNTINAYPYLEDFESGNGDWYHDGIASSWEHGIPTDSIIDTAASGINIWTTNLSGVHNQNEQSYLYTPCFDFSSMQRPKVKFSIWYEVEIVGTQFEYSTNGGQTWAVYGASADPNWYNQGYNWIGHSGDWVNVEHPLYDLAGMPKVQFRFIFTGVLQFSGFAIDHFEICEDPTANYTISANGLEVFFTDNSINSNTYYWDFGDGNTSILQSPEHTYAINDSVTVTQYVYNDCGVDSLSNTFYVTGMDELIKHNIKIYPNPVKDLLYIDPGSYSRPIEFSIMDINSKLIITEEINSLYTIDINGLDKGIYLYQLKSDDFVKIEKVIIN